jgi:O-antigen/teichoic acid export membrane protein
MIDDRDSEVRWSYFSTFSSAVLQLLAVATITRFLQPSDYGLMAMAMVCYSLTGYFTQLGMGRAIIQKSGLTIGNIRSAFTLSLATGIGGFVVACAIAPLLARYFREPRLKGVFIAFSLNLVFQALSMTSGGLLRREFRIRELAICDFFGYLISTFGLGLPMAMKGFGVWALVVSNVSQPLIVAIAYFIARPHSVRPTFAKENYEEISGFGGKVTLTTAIEAVAISLDTLMLGRLVSPLALGVYNRSMTLSIMPVYNLSQGVTRVFHPAIARAAEVGRSQCLKMLRMSEMQLMALIAPTCIGSAVAAKTIVPVLLGKQWGTAIPVYQALCIVGMIEATMHLPGIQLEVLSQFRRKIYVQSVFIIVWAIAILLTVQYGITAVAIAYAVTQVARSVWFHWMSAKSLEASLWGLLLTWLPGLICSVAVGAALYALQLALLRHAAVKAGLQLTVLVCGGLVVSVIFYRVFYKVSIYEPWTRLLKRQEISPV